MDVTASAITIRINALSAARFSDILPPAGCSTKYEQATARLAWIGLASLAGSANCEEDFPSVRRNGLWQLARDLVSWKPMDECGADSYSSNRD
jgi:hypothetical protein